MSTTAIVHGKALVSLRRGELFKAGWRCSPKVEVFVQSAQYAMAGPGHTDPHDFIHEDINTWFSLYGDKQFLSKMPTGGTVRFWMQYELTYTRDYWGECDFDLEPTGKIRFLRRQYPKPWYISKADRAKRNQLQRSL
jgi:hypothetical protein